MAIEDLLHGEGALEAMKAGRLKALAVTLTAQFAVVARCSDHGRDGARLRIARLGCVLDARRDARGRGAETPGRAGQGDVAARRQRQFRELSIIRVNTSAAEMTRVIEK